jgi:hypothetical protein
MKGIIIVNEKVAHYETGHDKSVWDLRFGNNPDIWDFKVSEILDGTVEPQSDILYWLIGERLYETTIQI